MKFYATLDSDSLGPSLHSSIPNVPVMLPASSWARKGLKAPILPRHVTDTAADCGGFVATFRWGDYRYTVGEYVSWLRSWKPRWAAMMDYCCEDEITVGIPGLVRERQERTTELAHRFWRDYPNESWAWVPTVQGWTVEDYRQHARDLSRLVYTMWMRGRPEFRVGIGTLCRRASVEMIYEVVSAVSEELPAIPIHLWGVKLGSLGVIRRLPSVVSVDSAAWNGMFRERRKEWKSSGMRQREYGYRVALPRYLEKVRSALGEDNVA